MSKKEERKLVKQYFTKRPPGTGYHANHVHLVDEKAAKEFQQQGFCRDAVRTIPEDLPGRKEFMAAGIETVEEIRALEDPTEVKGIGDTTAQELAEWFAEQES